MYVERCRNVFCWFIYNSALTSTLIDNLGYFFETNAVLYTSLDRLQIFLSHSNCIQNFTDQNFRHFPNWSILNVILIQFVFWLSYSASLKWLYRRSLLSCRKLSLLILHSTLSWHSYCIKNGGEAKRTKWVQWIMFFWCDCYSFWNCAFPHEDPAIDFDPF